MSSREPSVTANEFPFGGRRGVVWTVWKGRSRRDDSLKTSTDGLIYSKVSISVAAPRHFARILLLEGDDILAHEHSKKFQCLSGSIRMDRIGERLLHGTLRSVQLWSRKD